MRTKPAVRSRRSSPILNSWKGSGHYKYWGAGGWVICGVGCCYCCCCCYLSADAADSLEQTPTTGHYPPHCITVDRIFLVPDSLILFRVRDEGGRLQSRPLHKSEQLLIGLINVRYWLLWCFYGLWGLWHNIVVLKATWKRVYNQSFASSLEAILVFTECNSHLQLGELSKT